MRHVILGLGSMGQQVYTPRVTEEMLSQIEEIVNAEVIDDSEELIGAYVEEMPVLIAEIRRCWKLLDDGDADL